MIHKLTLDGGLLRESALLPAVQTLKTWEAAGKVELFEADRAKEVKTEPGWSSPVAPSKTHPRFRSMRKTEASGPSFQRISAVLFPHRDPNRLNMTEINNVAHLLRHHSLGHSIFVTTNAQDFVAEGRRERLQTAFKIVILTPDETVRALKASEAWDDAGDKQAAL